MWHSVVVRQQNIREFIADKACRWKLFNTCQCPGSTYNHIVCYSIQTHPYKGETNDDGEVCQLLL